MTENRACRPLRAGVFTLVCASLSAHGHALSSGHDVPLLGLLLGAAVVFAMAWAATGRRQGWAALTGWMLWGQFALHVAFSYVGSFGVPHTASHSGQVVAEAAAPAWTMIGMHVLSALVSAWWLRRGENALFSFLRFMALTFLPLLLVLGALPAPRGPVAPRPRSADAPARIRLPYLRHSLILRGPPVPSVA
ncbi:hypothetical protein ACOQFV_31085 [Nocardiopsis changdeensis]|uniref:MFS transporter n=1 Tax=Nocardiopsis changdeensis TaxID=2831969 RepID=A0ABX8BVC7_9ACTN|nr:MULTISPECIES: hypothetical protein [Nocardiopsis]QUX25057.1 hypothetical protein KGD84_12800 [Nocardiopsis changdeensis]QYX35443.1 hypothetical protein K1J57_22250 [Nocardiopsis sp. MT53]